VHEAQDTRQESGGVRSLCGVVWMVMTDRSWEARSSVLNTLPKVDKTSWNRRGSFLVRVSTTLLSTSVSDENRALNCALCS